MVGLAFVYLGIYSYEVIWQPSQKLTLIFDLSSNIITGIFLIDIIFRFLDSSRNWKFFTANFLEILALLVPFARALRVFRVLVAANAIHRVVRSRQAKATLYLATTIPLVAYAAALATLDAERQAPGATITTFPRALWWSVCAMGTASSGNLYPVTQTGKLVAVGLMAAGIGLFGTVAAIIAAHILKNDQPNTAAKSDA